MSVRGKEKDERVGRRSETAGYWPKVFVFYEFLIVTVLFLCYYEPSTSDDSCLIRYLI